MRSTLLTTRRLSVGLALSPLLALSLSACHDDPAGPGPDGEIAVVVAPPAGQSAFTAGRVWQLIGGRGVRGSWDNGNFHAVQVRSLVVYKGDLYVGLGDSAEEPDLGQLWKFDGSKWSLVGGSGVGGSWSQKRIVASLATDGTYLYAGLGSNPGDAEVWRYDSNTWEQIGGDNIREGWDDTHDYVWSMTFFRSDLYAGMFTEKLGEQRPVLYRFDGTRWHYVTGDSNPVSDRGGWLKNDGIIMVYRLFADPVTDLLYVGLAGRDTTPSAEPRTNPAEVWTWNGQTFSKIGGDGVNGSWNYSGSLFLEDVRRHGDDIIVSLQRDPSQGIHPLWRWNGSSWTPFASSYPAEWSTIQNFNTQFTYNGRLYVGAGLPTGERASFWELQPDQQWRRVGGRGEFGSAWHLEVAPTQTQWVYPIGEYRGHIVIGLASAETRGAAQVWLY